MSRFDIGKLMIGNIELTMLFKDSYMDLLKIEKNMKTEIKKLDFSKEFYFSGKKTEFFYSSYTEYIKAKWDKRYKTFGIRKGYILSEGNNYLYG
ncbi:hypothetical protein [Ilyobacter polytropus]|uniref:Uncharacterized protein n=1 Tax=Ilyobacter polytropus (strain ATCC 51220 / DSM 2926 / LMG 16218 / CuHBu1) TaxID=572544 RepID=E3H6H4_ILYPC|nr:hypothetical protein [Ilyobacter polytropus]ADO82387.1 hypothetical protein Ilyop_0599 [Ilyobacter polytropus DSM 2926]